MAEYQQGRWVELVERAQACGVDGLELNLSCPHGLPERKMGAAMGQDPEIVEQVCRWVKGAARVPFWAKMTPNITHIEDPSRAALRGGADGVAAINTIRCVIGVDLETLPDPNLPENLLKPGGRGVFFMRQVMDEVHMERTPNGSTLVLVKARKVREPHP